MFVVSQIHQFKHSPKRLSLLLFYTRPPPMIALSPKEFHSLGPKQFNASASKTRDSFFLDRSLRVKQPPQKHKQPITDVGTSPTPKNLTPSSSHILISHYIYSSRCSVNWL
ncbi:hypothetical protein TNCV_2547381 [Trichonephila clavipes]|nr:hypothetical protein TNCV_2547381 [Trichonephila clavipes]